MAKFEDREKRRRRSVVSCIIKSVPAAARKKRGRPKADREVKKRVSLSVMPSLYEDIQKIAYVQRRSISDLIGEWMEAFREAHKEELAEYRKVKEREKKAAVSYPEKE